MGSGVSGEHRKVSSAVKTAIGPLCYVRPPERTFVELAERITGGSAGHPPRQHQQSSHRRTGHRARRAGQGYVLTGRPGKATSRSMARATDGRARFAMGMTNGAWCVGCWLGSLLSFFALGVMSSVWMAVVAGLIALEKTLPWRRTATYSTAIVLLSSACWCSSRRRHFRV